MKYTAEATINAPIENVDLATWLYSLSDEEYQACSRGHKGAGTFVENGVRGMINVESVGGTLMLQHYHEASAGPTRMEMFSPRSRAYVFRLVPVPIMVRWTMTATRKTADTTTFSCTVEANMPAALRVLAASIFIPYLLRRHVQEETLLFAADIDRKLAAHNAPTVNRQVG
ncbi:hypothetical protein MSAS_34590 [Mycobacterium saskatchewanense]|uniref:Uncharacterized protein n=1 Tax=Mycobacterium saskatchewanense TaxID=220927 RepID=A0AAJ3NPX2_9MYCO|nr:hypothetical protein [Mycobacterium saskatchewanense]ORW70553.1 hypothetical protein AWC23_16945 [Mycobacterium saskatchewanense]BBX64285.1 hypothetical protein MSAS_34590 [Mycobacterium saskatchewanense]